MGDVAWTEVRDGALRTVGRGAAAPVEADAGRWSLQGGQRTGGGGEAGPRVAGAGDPWVTEYLLTDGGRPAYTVSIMEFLGGKMAHETRILAICSGRGFRTHNGLSRCLETEPL